MPGKVVHTQRQMQEGHGEPGKHETVSTNRAGKTAQ